MSCRNAEQLARALPAGRRTRQRGAVLHVLLDCPDFVSAQQLHALTTADGIGVGLTTVYRTLRELEARGRVDVVRDDVGERLYRIRPFGRHRHYLVCRACGRSRPVEADAVEAWVDLIGEAAGFDAVEHTVELTGICATCRTDAPAVADDGEPL
ncbi:Fur family transcriptional regulator [Planotetraspora phitsanulokensis]|uniref:Transcriptional repressor n=1 Tax=Planotetraspora phitsanulokensis TaxID=575192 RepID=A0A8J3U9N7_9ACTN|nr:Fur family transcriptional regulator [Planotetraspora phitsanulokensis]GII39627.1 transcriptional repressor [Planotetraspora phitsanulokensis]